MIMCVMCINIINDINVMCNINVCIINEMKY